jgi:hypothetical protein
LGDARAILRVPAERPSETPRTTLAAVGAWYPIGIAAGVGVAIGLLLAGISAPRRPVGLAAALAVSAGAALAVGYVLEEWGALSGVVGALVGALVGSQLVGGSLGRGGTRGGTAILVAGAAAILAALALVPVVGYLEAALLPVLGARLRRRAGGTYAGLRILARD